LILLAPSKVEAAPYFVEVTKMMAGVDSQLYPLNEISWLLVTAWNWGAELFRLGDPKGSEK
jgi:hypothetical protein